KHRRRTSQAQARILEAAFEENPKPSATKRRSLAEELLMKPRNVQIWFQNRRAKAKQQ
ncbi:homeobox domain-containing protein, partial [Syncephalastrum racemosum]